MIYNFELEKQLLAGLIKEPDALAEISNFIGIGDFYSENKEDAEKVIGQHSLENIEAADLAPWVSVSRIILNLDETITRE